MQNITKDLGEIYRPSSIIKEIKSEIFSSEKFILEMYRGAYHLTIYNLENGRIELFSEDGIIVMPVLKITAGEKKGNTSFKGILKPKTSLKDIIDDAAEIHFYLKDLVNNYFGLSESYNNKKLSGMYYKSDKSYNKTIDEKFCVNIKDQINTPFEIHI